MRLKNGSGRDFYDGSAALQMSALHDPEDDRPAFFCRPMNNDEDDRSDTIAAPAELSAEERKTNPDELRSPILPPAALELDAELAEAIKTVAEAAREIRAERQFKQTLLDQNAEILAAIQRADHNQTANYALLRDEIRHLKDSDIKQDQRLKEGDQRFERIEKSIEDLKEELFSLVTRATADAAERIDALEKDLADAKDHAAR